MILHFNPRSHERSDFEQWYVSNGFSISIHAPTRGATNMSVQIICIVLFQSTLPREERQWWGVVCTSTIYISIHAPTRGATFDLSFHLLPFLFQSTLPREERHLLSHLILKLISISIHAPTRGATAILHKKFVYFYTIPTINI